MKQDLYDLFDDFINSEFLDNVITNRLIEYIGMTRSSIEALEHRNCVKGGLEKHEREDLENDWRDLEALTTTYIYFSGDYDLKALPEWPSTDEQKGDSAWDYWNQGELK